MTSDRTKVKVVLNGVESIFTGVTTSDIAATHAAFATNCLLTNFNGGKPSANGSGLVISSDNTTRPAIVSAEFISVDKLKIKFDRAILLTNTDPVNDGSGVKYITLDNNGSELTFGKDGAGNMALDTNDTTNVTLLVTLNAAQDTYVTSGFGTDASITGLGIKSGSGIKAASSGLELMAFGAATTSADHKRVAADTTAPTDFSTTQLEKVAYDNVNLKVTSSAALTPTEKARVEVYIGADTPAKTANVYTAYNAYVAPGAGWDAGAADPLIASVVGAAVPVTHKVFYRFKDVAGNISEWKQRGTVGLPAGTYKKVAATSTTSGEAVVSNTNTLVVGNGTTTTSYDITNNATVKNLMTNLANNDTFTVDSSSLINAIVASNIAGPATVTFTAADLASSVSVTGAAAQVLTLAGAATSKTISLAAANGGYVMNATGATALTVAGATTGTVKIDQAVATVNVNANVTTLDINAGVATLNVADAVTVTTATIAAVTANAMTIAATGTGVITTATVDADLTTCALTVNDTVTGSAAIATLNVPAQTISFTTAGTGTITAANVTGAIATVTIGSVVTTFTNSAAITTLNVNANVNQLVAGAAITTLNNAATATSTIADLTINDTITIGTLANGVGAAGIISDINVPAAGTGTITTFNMNTAFANTAAIPADVAGTKLVIGTLNITAHASAALTITGTTAAKLEIGTIALGAATGGSLVGASAANFTLKGNITVSAAGTLGTLGNTANLVINKPAADANRTITTAAGAKIGGSLKGDTLIDGTNANAAVAGVTVGTAAANVATIGGTATGNGATITIVQTTGAVNNVAL